MQQKMVVLVYSHLGQPQGKLSPSSVNRICNYIFSAAYLRIHHTVVILMYIVTGLWSTEHSVNMKVGGFKPAISALLNLFILPFYLFVYFIFIYLYFCFW